MSLFRREIVGIGLSPQATAASRVANGVPHVRVLTHPAETANQCAKVIDALDAPASKVRRHCRVVLTGPWAREWIMRVPAGLNSLTELRDLASARFAQLFDEAAEQWMITGDWRSSGPMLCGAIPRQLHDSIASDLAQQCSPAEFTTFASLCVHAAQVWREPGWWCIKCPESLILAVVEERTLALLRTLPAPANESEKEQLTRIAAEAVRSALRDGIEAPRTIHYVDLTGDSTMHEQRLGTVEFRSRPLVGPLSRDGAIERDVALAACLEAQR